MTGKNKGTVQHTPLPAPITVPVTATIPSQLPSTSTPAAEVDDAEDEVVILQTQVQLANVAAAKKAAK